VDRKTVEQIHDIERAMVAIRRSQTRRSLSRLAHKQHGKAGVSGHDASFDVLDAIEAAEQAGEPASVSSVASALSVDQPRASRLVAAAVAAGLVQRRADQADGRRALLVRTPAGRSASEKVHQFRREQFAAAIADWPPDDRAHLARLLPQFVDSLKSITSERSVPGADGAR
jgi:DNA-binding MarR family transcriptional regulator